MSAFDPSRATAKTNESINKALELAHEAKHVELTPYHLAYVLFDEADGLAGRICAKAKADCKMVVSELKDALKRLSVQDPPPPEVSPNSAFLKVLRNANNLMKKNGDSFMTVDHLLLALADDDGVGKAMAKAGLTKSKIEGVIKDVRGTSKVTSKQAEQTYEALEKYGRIWSKTRKRENSTLSSAATKRSDALFRSYRGAPKTTRY